MTEPRPDSPRVRFVGAGPGAADLLTVRAVRFLASAEFVLHDALVEAPVLELAPRAAHRSWQARAAPVHCATLYQQDTRRLRRKSSHVVRLKGGDPLIFGRLDEEMQQLRAANIGFEVARRALRNTGASTCALRR